MRSLGKVILYGFLIWLVVFVVAVAIFPIRELWRPLFESIMPVAITLTTALFAHLYLKKVTNSVVRVSGVVGLVWLMISVLIDLPLMLTGPMEMALSEYVADIAVTYLIIPVVVVGMGVTRATALNESSNPGASE